MTRTPAPVQRAVEARANGRLAGAAIKYGSGWVEGVLYSKKNKLTSQKSRLPGTLIIDIIVSLFRLSLYRLYFMLRRARAARGLLSCAHHTRHELLLYTTALGARVGRAWGHAWAVALGRVWALGTDICAWGTDMHTQILATLITLSPAPLYRQNYTHDTTHAHPTHMFHNNSPRMHEAAYR